jgi:hypothetical protein
MNSRNKSLVGSVLESMNPDSDPDILLNPDPDQTFCGIRIQAVAESGSNPDPDLNLEFSDFILIFFSF